MWIEAQAAQYITTFTTCKVLDLSQNSIRLPRRNAITSKAENYIKIQRKQGTSNTPPQQQKKRQKRSNRSYKGKDRQRHFTSLTLRNHQKAHSSTREPREQPGAWEKRFDKAAATWNRHQIVHSGPHRAPCGWLEAQRRGERC